MGDGCERRPRPPTRRALHDEGGRRAPRQEARPRRAARRRAPRRRAPRHRRRAAERRAARQAAAPRPPAARLAAAAVAAQAAAAVSGAARRRRARRHASDLHAAHGGAARVGVGVGAVGVARRAHRLHPGARAPAQRARGAAHAAAAGHRRGLPVLHAPEALARERAQGDAAGRARGRGRRVRAGLQPRPRAGDRAAAAHGRHAGLPRHVPRARGVCARAGALRARPARRPLQGDHALGAAHRGQPQLERGRPPRGRRPLRRLWRRRARGQPAGRRRRRRRRAAGRGLVVEPAATGAGGAAEKATE
ncbi:hypothetical protein FGB62_73g026 [Gracilaria domingensis]|nr:hypothetical protein FGB62_73g026 [Gracilaria domingensis]